MTSLDAIRSWSDGHLRELIRQCQPWLEQYGLWAVVVGLFTETLMFTGFVVPGYGLLIAAGYLAAEGVLPLVPLLCFAALGAVLGDQASFALGYYAGERLLRRKQAWAARIRDGLENRGLWWLLWYHHVPPLRATLPCVAGSLHFPYARWLLLDSVGVFLWIGVVIGVGYATNGAVRGDSGLAAQLVNGIIAVLSIAFLWRMQRALRRA